MKYVVKVESLVGVYGHSHKKGTVLTEDKITKSHIAELVSIGAIEAIAEVKEPEIKPSKTEKDKK